MDEDQSREKQTNRIVRAIIIAVVAIVGTMILMEKRAEYNERYPGCWMLIGEDSKCKAEVAARRLGL